MNEDKNIQNRLNRIEGQIRGISKMVEQNKDCKDLISQITAARNALDKTMILILSNNLETCIRQSIENDNEDRQLIEEAIKLMIKSK